MNRLLLLTFATSLVACGGGSKSDTAATANPCGDNPCGDNPCGDNPCGGDGAGAAPVDTGVDFSGWQSWTKINDSEAFVSKGHKKPWVNVYTQADHAELYKSGGEKPEGFAVVKAIHKDEGGTAGAVESLTVMVKMGADYDPDNGNWYYGVLSPDGSKAMKEGKLEMCQNCHSSGDDYLFQGSVVGK